MLSTSNFAKKKLWKKCHRSTEPFSVFLQMNKARMTMFQATVDVFWYEVDNVSNTRALVLLEGECWAKSCSHCMAVFASPSLEDFIKMVSAKEYHD